MTPAGIVPRPQRMRPAVPAVLAFGSNLGNREATIRAAVADAGAVAGIRVLKLSSLIETPALKPAGVDRDAPAYLNAVATIETVLDPHALLETVNAIEAQHGRVREEHWGDRTLDIDIVDYDGRQSEDATLTLPHPGAASRVFVLAPWLEIAPDAVVPGRGRVDALLAALGARWSLEDRASDPATPAPSEPASEDSAPGGES